MTSRLKGKRKPVLITTGSLLAVAVLIIGTFLPAMFARAEQTLTWTSNADFAYNKITGECSPTLIEELTISGDVYSDDTCVSDDQDASLSLASSSAYIQGATSITTGNHTSMVMKDDGSLYAWGLNTSGQLGIGNTSNTPLPTAVKDVAGSSVLSNVTDVSAGGTHACAVASGQAFCWGYGGTSSSLNQLGNSAVNSTTIPVPVTSSGVLSGKTVTDISASSQTNGQSHTCVVANGQAFCWGMGSNGRLGRGSTTSSGEPVAVSTAGVLAGKTVTQISAGSSHTCAVADGQAFCWGNSSSSGKLGNNSTSDSTVPVAVSTTGVLAGKTVTQISAGSSHTCAVADGQAFCWGSGASGILGNNSTSSSMTPVAVDTSGVLAGKVVTYISAGTSHTCAVADGQAFCWGAGSNGRLGNNATSNSSVPVAVDTSDVLNGAEVSNISVAEYHTCADSSQGGVYCWGDNSAGALGINSYGTATIATPTEPIGVASVDFLNSAEQVAAGTSHTCALADGLVYCWGSGTSGQLGNNSTSSSTTPVAVDATGVLAGKTITQIEASGSQTCALADGLVYCWGGGISTVPVAVDTSGVLAGKTVTQIEAGSSHVCAVADGQAFCWGNGSSGQLGNNSTSTSTSPVAVDTSGVLAGKVVTYISAGTSHTCAVADGQAFCWGSGSNGKLGNNSTSDSAVPVAVNTSGVLAGRTVTKIAAGGIYHTCAVADGTAFCWGAGLNGRLGNGSSDSLVPAAVYASDVLSGKTVTDIAVGGDHACVIANSAMFCWGQNNRGAIGSTGQHAFTPRAVDTQTMSGNVTSITTSLNTNSSQYTCAVSNSQVYCWGEGGSGRLGTYGYNSTGNANSVNSTPIPVTLTVDYMGGFSTSGTISGFKVDVGAGKKTQWYTISWQSEYLPENTSIIFNARVSDDGESWTPWTDNIEQISTGTTTGGGSLESLPMSRFIELRGALASTNNMVTPTLNELSISYLEDEQPPTQNASNLVMERERDGSTVDPNGWTNLQTPYFAWDVAQDNENGSGIQGYCLYAGQDGSADPTQTKGLLGDSPLNTGNACPYAVSAAEIDFGVVGTLATELETSSTPYVLLVSAIDFSGNIYDGDPASFSFRYDDEPPRNPSFISAPSQFVSTKDVTLTWPTSGAESAQDNDSGVAGLQYRIGSGGTWYGDGHNGAQNASDLLANDGSYATNETYDYPALQEGNNIVYFRTYDQAGNVSESHITTVIKLNTSSPTSPQNLTATPTTNTSNSFAFSWLAPASFVGQASGIVYCYTINTVPTGSNCNFTNPGQTSLPADSFATQPGDNTFYVVARDEASNVNYATYASVSFTANTPAPGIVQDFEIADVSTKASSLWKLAISWSEPDNTGAGVAKYLIERSTNGTDFTQVANTSGLSYVDSSLSQQEYFYKVRACDSANNCGAFSSVTSMTPTGRFTTPPELVGNVSSQVGTKTASFNWATDRNADSRIQYGTSSGVYLPSEVTVSDQTQSHELELFNLEAGTTYFYKVKWTDEDGNTGISSELSFTTLPAPSIKDVQIVKRNLSSVIIQFTSTDATKVDLLYGKSDSFGGITTVNTSRSESTYLIELTGLDDGTAYSFRLNTYDTEGNKYDSNRTDSFTTPPRPRISNLRFQPVEGEPTSTQEITWTTNVPADSTITYGKIGTNGTDVYTSQKTADHTITIRNLEDDSNYFLLAQSRDEDGNLAVSDRQVFRTALDTRSPTISDIKVTTAIKGSGGDARGQIVVYWKTDEPSSSQVAYGLGASGSDYPNRTAEDMQLTTDHVVIISDLPVANVYYLQPVSRDRSKNTSSGDSRSAVIGRPTDSILNIIINSIQSILGI